MEETHSTLPLPLHIAMKPGPTACSGYVRTLKGKLWHAARGMKSAFTATLSQWWVFRFFSLQYAVAWTQHSRLGSGHQDRTQAVFREATSFWPDTVKRELLTPKESMDTSRLSSLSFLCVLTPPVSSVNVIEVTGRRNSREPTLWWRRMFPSVWQNCNTKRVGRTFIFLPLSCHYWPLI